ncbi:MAG: RNA polymerase sigma factor [Bacteroidaceae bacterium]|nr:RNA polymerase sigma factor [Bacteroidaceae bacterium]
MSKNFLIAAYEKLQQRLRYGLSHAQEDALNDAFLKLWGGNYDPASAAEGEWMLSQATRHRQISLWRSEKRHPKVSSADLQITVQPTENGVDDTFLRIKHLIETRLTPLQQDILTRHDLEDETYSEIAERLGMQETAVRMQLSRARKIIREEYKRAEG